MARIQYYLHTPRESGTVAMVVHKLPEVVFVKETGGAQYYDEKPMLMQAARLVLDHDEDHKHHRWEISAHNEWGPACYGLERIGGSVYVSKYHIASHKNWTIEICPDLDLIQPASPAFFVG